MTSVSVVIPAWNGLTHLQRNLPAIMALGADEIIVVDDASSDGTAEFLHDHYPEILVLPHLTNQRFPTSANDGFHAAKGEIVVLLNQDLRPDKDLLKSVLPHFKNPHNFAVTFNEQGRSWARAEFKHGFIEFTNGPLDAQTHLSFWASGGSAAFRTSLWHQLGGFDIVFTPGYFEDFDIGFRAYKRGLRIIWEPAARVIHETESAFKAAFTQKQLTAVKERNFLLAQWKNLDAGHLFGHFLALFVRICTTPGFLKPTLAAIFHLPEIIVFRLREKKFIKTSDSAVFQLIAHGL